MLRRKKRGAGKKQISGKRAYELLLRYSVILLASLGNLWIFYFVFSPLTFYPLAFLLGFFYDLSTAGYYIIIRGIMFDIARACVAGSAYYLLFMLNLMTRDIRIKKRIAMFLFSSLLFLLLNIARVILLVFVRVNNLWFFEQLHMFFWYFVSTAYVFAVWVIMVKIFRIEAIPFYSDFIYLKGLRKKPNKVYQAK